MKVFVASSYASKVNYSTGEVDSDFKAWLETILEQLESYGHEVFSALRADQYKINDDDPAKAFILDENEIKKADAMFAIVSDRASTGIQTEIGIAIAERKSIVLAHEPDHDLSWFNKALVHADRVGEVTLPITSDPFSKP